VERFFLDYEYSDIEKEFPRRRFKVVNVVKILGGVLILILLVEALGILVGNLTSKPVVAEWGTIEKGFWAEVLFLRDESVLIAPLNGDLTIKITDGTRVPRGEIAATINTIDSGNAPDDNTDLQVRLQSLDREVQSFQEDLERVRLEIAAQKPKLSHIPKKSVKVRSASKDLVSIEQEKTRILGNIEYTRLQIQLITKKINNRKNGMVFVSVDKPGYLFYQYDEWEEHFSPDQFAGLTPIDFNRVYTLKSPGKVIKAGAVIGKVVNPFHQIITLVIDPKQTGIPVNGDLWGFKSGENTFQCPVINHTQLTDGKIILALEDDSMLPEFMPNRRAKVFIIYKRISGITIPVQALYRRGGKMTVKVVKGDGYKETNVIVLENDGVKAIISGIEFGTTIISR
jgi:hypothetical protein